MPLKNLNLNYFVDNSMNHHTMLYMQHYIIVNLYHSEEVLVDEKEFEVISEDSIGIIIMTNHILLQPQYR